MGQIWNFIKTIYQWSINNTDKLGLIVIIVICIILAPILIGIIKSLISGIWALFKLIFSIR